MFQIRIYTRLGGSFRKYVISSTQYTCMVIDAPVSYLVTYSNWIGHMGHIPEIATYYNI